MFYAVLLALIAYAWQQLPPSKGCASQQPFVSVLIAARNEAKHLETLLSSLQQQTYSADHFEVLLIDDHSTDNSRELIQPYLSAHIRLLSMPEGQTGKKQALALAIKQSQGAYLFTTDADCILPGNWLKTLVHSLQSGADMVLAPVRLHGDLSFLSAFQGLDVAGTMLLTGAAVQAGYPALANGANLGFKRSLLDQLGGYTIRMERSSGDDVFLLHAAAQVGARIAYIKSPATLVDTAAVDNWAAFFRQRLRWAGKTSSYRHWGLLGFQAFVFLLSWVLLLTPIICSGQWKLWLLAWGIKTLSDGLFLAYACREVGRTEWMWWLPLASVCHTVYVAGIGLMALLPVQVSWKGRTIK